MQNDIESRKICKSKLVEEVENAFEQTFGMWTFGEVGSRAKKGVRSARPWHCSFISLFLITLIHYDARHNVFFSRSLYSRKSAKKWRWNRKQ